MPRYVAAVCPWLLLLAIVWLASLLAPGAVAGPPLVTDDPGTPGAGTWEVNVSHNLQRTRNTLLMAAPLFDINFGWQDNDELGLAVPVLLADPDDGDAHWGVGDLVLHYKYRLVEEEQWGLAVSTSPALLVPVGNEKLGLGDLHTHLFLPVEIGKTFLDEDLFVYAEVGYRIAVEDVRASWWFFGVAAEWAIAERFTLAGEVASTSFLREVADDDVFFNAGCKYHLADDVNLLFSAGRSLRDRDRGWAELSTFLGLQMFFGGRCSPPRCAWRLHP